MVHKHEVPVLSFISDCVSMFSAQAREGGVTVSFADRDISDGVSADALSLDGKDSVFIDRFKMDQVLRNIISNTEYRMLNNDLKSMFGIQNLVFDINYSSAYPLT